jgi:hypothetical protein
MKSALRRIGTTHGRYEAGATGAGDRPWPGPIRRGLAGDGEAAAEIAELLDDSDVRFRRKAAELLFDLNRTEGIAPLRLALDRDDDPAVRRWAALALARIDAPSDVVIEILNGADREAQRAAALALGEHGDIRAAPVLVAWWQSERIPFPRAREVLRALAKLRAKEAVLPLIASLGDLRLRPYIAHTLASIGHPAARIPLAERLAVERHKDTRTALAAALVHLGARSELAAPLFRFLGTPDPLPDGVDMARRAGLLALIGTTDEDRARLSGAGETPVPLRFKTMTESKGKTSTEAQKATEYRLLLRGASTDNKAARVSFTACSDAGRRSAGHDDSMEAAREEARAVLEFSEGPARELFFTLPPALAPMARDFCIAVQRTHNLAIEGIAVVPLVDDLPPPPPEPWEAAPAATSSAGAPSAGTAAFH